MLPIHSPSSSEESPASWVSSPASTGIPLVSALFGQSALGNASYHRLQIITLPNQVVHGFVLDAPQIGRRVFIQLDVPRASSDQDQPLGANFSEVLRPHDPLRGVTAESAPSMLDIKASLTALLDLASDSLAASSLVLVINKDSCGQDLGDLLHDLMYAGGQVMKPGVLNGLKWDTEGWVLVGMEL